MESGRSTWSERGDLHGAPLPQELWSQGGAPGANVVISMVHHFLKNYGVMKLMGIMITFQAIVYALQKVQRISNTNAEKLYRQKIRWTKEEMTTAGEDLMRNACNIAPEDRLIYRQRADRLAKRLLL